MQRDWQIAPVFVAHPARKGRKNKSAKLKKKKTHEKKPRALPTRVPNHSD
jgi:hypothetical protein